MTPRALVISVFAVFVFAIFARWVSDTPREEPLIGLLFRLVQVYSRVYQHLQVRGSENIPQSKHPGPLIVICNHTGGVDPLLVQTCCPFEVRWMMATDMRSSRYEWFWRWTRVISVDRTGKPARHASGPEGSSNASDGVREAVRHVKAGGILGVFPEGAIEHPAGKVLPFHPGVGLMISRTGAPVLPVIIEGTAHNPRAASTLTSVLHSSHARVTFGPVMCLLTRSLGPRRLCSSCMSGTWGLRVASKPSRRIPDLRPAVSAKSSDATANRAGSPSTRGWP